MGTRTDTGVAIVGSGPSGLACAGDGFDNAGAMVHPPDPVVSKIGDDQIAVGSAATNPSL